MSADADPTRIPRRAVAVVLAAFILGAPGLRMIGRYDTHLFPAWVMYHGNGRDLCTVDFHTDDQRSVDRLAVLGSPVGIFAPRHQKRLTKEKDIRAQGAVLCQKLKAKEVTVDALCGTRAWTMDRIIPATDNLCRKGR